MRVRDVLKLNTGDEVYWTDPCEIRGDDHTSRYITIQHIHVQGQDEPDFDPDEFYDAVISIVGKDGTELECFASELS